VKDQAKLKPKEMHSAAIETRIREPLGANAVPDVDRTIDRIIANSNDLANTPVKLDETFARRKLCLSLDGVVMYDYHTAVTL